MLILSIFVAFSCNFLGILFIFIFYMFRSAWKQLDKAGIHRRKNERIRWELAWSWKHTATTGDIS
jgi:hypothetical protein